MKQIRNTLIALLCMLTVGVQAQSSVNIIPKPRKMEVGNAQFSITASTKIVCSDNLREQAQLLNSYISSAANYDLQIVSSSKPIKNSIELAYNPAITSDEGYTLTATTNGVVIKAKNDVGIFYGIQTLLQLLPAQIAADKPQKGVQWSIPTVTIADEPQFPWRGMMLDVSRYFFTKEYVLRFMDMMAMYKMNTLHLHLVDDSGWRLESKKYPLLTEIGAFRGEGEKRTGGFYTQDEIREMVKYGQLRGIEIIPEIEFPAHILSAVVPYPWLSCREEQLKMPEQHYISKDLICVGKESSIQFLEDILEETFALFPSKYVHIGGDEAVYDYWDECPKCQAVMAANGLTKSEQLQSYLTNVVAKMAAKHKRTVVGWDEILERGKVDYPVVSMIWRDLKNIDNVLALGHKAVLAPADYTYLDFPESRLPSEMKAAGWKGPISMEKCYNFDISAYENNKNIVGVHGCMWADQFIHGTILQELDLLDENRSENYINYFMLPRLLAVSEVVWAPAANKNYADFESRYTKHFQRLDYAGFNYRVPTPVVVSTEKVADGYLVALSTPLEGATIHYTTDGNRPTTYDKRYTDKVKVTQLSDLRAITALTKTRHSVPLYFEEDYSAYADHGTLVKKIQHSALSANRATTIEVDLTGKIAANGNYQLSFVPLTEDVQVQLGDITILKLAEQSAQVTINESLTAAPITTQFAISQWQAGTPYSGKIVLTAETANRGNIGIFLKRID